MKRIHISGYSDNCVEIEIENKDDERMADEFYVWNKPGWLKIETPSGEGLAVFAQYDPDGCPDGTWVLGITMLEEDWGLPNWPISFKTVYPGYSPTMMIDAPDDAVLSYGKGG